MAELPENIAELIELEKALGFVPDWIDQPGSRHLELIATLTVGEIIVGGFELRAKVSKQFPDRDALMQLEYSPYGRKRIELWRCEWRPLSGHTNRGWGPPGFELQELLGSHEHPFEYNYVQRENRMRRGGSLPAAIPIKPDFGTLSDFIAFCGERFRIKNIRAIPLPKIMTDLFWTPDD